MRLPPPKGKRKKAGRAGEEWMYDCPRGCKGKRNKAPLEVNTATGLAHCFICGLSFKVPLGKSRVVSIIKRYEVEEPEGDVPTNLYRVFRERGVDPLLSISRYQIRWDGSRLCFPVYLGGSKVGYWKRAVYKQQQPKVLSGAHGVLGLHLLRQGSYCVLTEGDFKALSIPLPWIGVAIGGTHLSPLQAESIAATRPKEVVVALDGGVPTRKVVNSLRRYSIPTKIIKLPENKGPDDIERRELVCLLTK